MPKNETDIQFVRTFKYVRWDKNNYKWVIPNYGQNQAVNAARLFFKTIQGSKVITEQIDRPRREHKLPLLSTILKLMPTDLLMTNGKH